MQHQHLSLSCKLSAIVCNFFPTLCLWWNKWLYTELIRHHTFIVTVRSIFNIYRWYLTIFIKHVYMDIILRSMSCSKCCSLHVNHHLLNKQHGVWMLMSGRVILVVFQHKLLSYPRKVPLFCFFVFFALSWLIFLLLLHHSLMNLLLLLPIWGWVVVAADLAGYSKLPTRQQCFPTPHGGPQGPPELAGICIYALQRVLGLPWCVHPVGTAKSTTRGILIRCQDLLKWLIWTPRSSSSIWSSFWMSALLTLSLRLRPASLGRTLISPPRIRNLVPRSLPYCTQHCNIVVCTFISSRPSSWQRVFSFFFGQNWNSQILCVNVCALREQPNFQTVKTCMIKALFEGLQSRF